jgi:hypothetical protein
LLKAAPGAAFSLSLGHNLLLAGLLEWRFGTVMEPVPEQAILWLPLRRALFDGPLPVGVVLDSRQPPPWVDALLTFLRQIPGSDTRILPLANRGRSSSRRPAGQLFSRKGRLFRPAQDCLVRFGDAIAIDQTPEELEERPVSYLPPSWKPQLQGSHTWKESSVSQVIDGRRYVE